MKLGRGRPRKKGAQDGRVEVRMDAGMMEKLRYLSEETGTSKSDILRKGLEMQYKFYTVTH